MPKKKKSKIAAREKEKEKSPHPLRQSYGPEEAQEDNSSSSKHKQQQQPPEEEDEDEEDDGVGGMFGGLTGLNNLIDKVGEESEPKEDEEKERMKLLLSNFNPEQMARYEAFRRANVNRTSVKKLANAVLSQSITGNVAVGLSGMSKVFVGEIVERARDVQQRMEPVNSIEELENQERPLKPEHFREAWRLYKLEQSTVPAAHWRRQGGDGDGTMFR